MNFKSQFLKSIVICSLYYLSWPSLTFQLKMLLLSVMVANVLMLMTTVVSTTLLLMCVATANLLGNLMLYSLFLPIYSVAHKNVVFISFHSLDAVVHDLFGSDFFAVDKSG